MSITSEKDILSYLDDEKIDDLEEESLEERLETDEEIEEDIKQLYLKEISKIPLLTKEEVYELAKRMRDEKDEEAKKKLIESNLRLVVSFAKKFSNKGISFLDLIQEGNKVLVEKMEGYDYTTGNAISTYLSLWIKQSMYRVIENQARTIRKPVWRINVFNRVLRAIETLTYRLNRKPTVSEIVEETNMTLDEINLLFEEFKDNVSLETPIGEKEKNLIDFMPDKYNEAPDDYVIRRELKTEISDILSKLKEVEQEVIKLSFGLEDNAPKSNKEVADILEVEIDKIQYIKRMALKKLRLPSKIKKLDVFLTS